MALDLESICSSVINFHDFSWSFIISQQMNDFITAIFITSMLYKKAKTTSKWKACYKTGNELLLYYNFSWTIWLHDGWTVLPTVLFFLFTHDALLLAVVMCRHPCHAAISLANAIVLCILISRKWLRSWLPRARSDLETLAMISFWYYTHHALHVASSLLKTMFCTVTWQNSYLSASIQLFVWALDSGLEVGCFFS